MLLIGNESKITHMLKALTKSGAPQGRSMNRTKRCSECGEVKPKEQFARSLLSLDARSAHCLLCKEKEIGGGRADRWGMYGRLKQEHRRRWEEEDHGGGFR